MKLRETYKHLERIETELNSANRRRQVWLHVGILTSLTDLALLGDLSWHDSQVNSDLDRLAILVGRQDEGVVIAELERSARRHLLLEECIIVALVEDDLLLGQTHILEDLLEIESPLADIVVRLEEIEVPSLQDEQEWVLARRFHVEHDSVVEGGSAT